MTAKKNAKVIHKKHKGDGKKRCAWCGDDALYVKYHDKEWGVPVYDDQMLFEFLILEGAQAGLSWLTVLRKRENYRKAFLNFDPNKVAKFSEKKILRLLQDEGIIRNKLKIRATVNNAKCFLKVQKEFGSFAKYQWSFVNGRQIVNNFKSMKSLPAKTEVSNVFAKDLKDRGFKFVGSTIIYAHMQACGMVNDHEISCFRYNKVARKTPRHIL